MFTISILSTKHFFIFLYFCLMKNYVFKNMKHKEKQTSLMFAYKYNDSK